MSERAIEVRPRPRAQLKVRFKNWLHRKWIWVKNVVTLSQRLAGHTVTDGIIQKHMHAVEAKIDGLNEALTACFGCGAIHRMDLVPWSLTIGVIETHVCERCAPSMRARGMRLVKRDVKSISDRIHDELVLQQQQRAIREKAS